jgi:threonine dehydrogenase-like Zn-dependent dehydrogenase
VRALWLEDRSLRLRDDLPRPQPPPGEALVRVRLAGVCNTDLELARGYYPYAGIPGHEFVGVVERSPSAPEWVGRRVVGEINAVCGECPTCRSGRPTHCERRTVLGIVARDGAFASHLLLPVANLHAVPDPLPDEVAVFTEPTAAALEIQQQVRISRGERVVVVGAGKLGQLVAQTLAPTGCDLLVVGRSRRSLDLVTGRGLRSGTAEAIVSRAADIAVECTGSPEGLELARQAVRPRGTVVLKSTYHGKASVDMAPFVVDEITLVGSRCGPFAPALEMLARGIVDPRPLLEARYPLEQALAAFEHAGRPGTFKVLVDCGSELSGA